MYDLYKNKLEVPHQVFSSEKLRVGIICHGNLGGSSVVSTHLAEQLAQREHHVHLFTQYPTFNHLLRSGRVVLHKISFTAQQKSAEELYTNWQEDEFRCYLEYLEKAIAENSLDILNFNYALPFAFLAALLKQRLGQKCPVLVLTLHGSDVYDLNKNKELCLNLRKALLEFDALTTVSFFLSQLAASVLNLPKRPLVIPNFIDIQAYPSKNDQIMIEGPYTKTPVIVHISNFRPIKNSIAVAEIFIKLRKKRDVKLKLVGEGLELSKIKALLKLHHLEDHVSFLGMRSDIAHILLHSDLLLMTSHMESFCLVALEAMACGTPVVAPRVGGIPEVVRHAKNGYLFSGNDQWHIAEEILNLLNDDFRYKKISEECRKRARYFSTDRIVPRYESLYRSLIKSA
jgi:N-acetyl-alpha-D-glucosaminyl L-malate synthase BshA